MRYKPLILGVAASIMLVGSQASTGRSQAPYLTLVGHWQFDEGAGTTAFDSSGFGNNGIVHDASWVSGIQGYALHFDGSDDSYVEVPNKPELSPTTHVIVDAWIKPETYPTYYTAIVYKADLQHTECLGERSYSLWATVAGQIHFTSTPEGENCQYSYHTPAGLIPTGQWSQLVADLNAEDGKIRIFLNGQQVFEADYPQKPIKPGDSPLMIGGMIRTATDQSHFVGAIDDVRVYTDSPGLVGGVVEPPDAAESAPATAQSSHASSIPWTAPAGVAAAFVAVAVGAWYVRRHLFP